MRMDLTPIIADIVIAAVLVLAVWIGAKRGLLQSLAGVIIVVAAFFGASWAANTFDEMAAQWMRPLLEDYLQQTIAAQQQTAGVEDLLQSFQFGVGDLQQQIEEIMQQMHQTGAAAVDAVMDSVTLSIAHAAVFVASFIVLVIVLWLLMIPLKLMTKLPGVHAVNAIGGGALGLVWGTLVVFLAVWAMGRFGWLITPEMVEKSCILRFFANNSPLSLLALLSGN